MWTHFRIIWRADVDGWLGDDVGVLAEERIELIRKLD
jgi:hypothetical protein